LMHILYMFPYKQIIHNGKTRQQHRVIMEAVLERKLKSTELVHHIDGNPKNNNIKNLQLMNWKEHGKLHAKKPVFTLLTCKKCKRPFIKRKSRYKLLKKKGQKDFYCSRKCQGLSNSKYLPHEKGSKYKKLIDKELKKGLTGYKISKKYNINKATVYNYINKYSSSPIVKPG